jgi:site-specific DNA recombinase
MEHTKSLVQRCAVYTRKSSEEGLEQDFNSLQAQREACEAFIKSQPERVGAWSRPDTMMAGGCHLGRIADPEVALRPRASRKADQPRPQRVRAGDRHGSSRRDRCCFRKPLRGREESVTELTKFKNGRTTTGVTRLPWHSFTFARIRRSTFLPCGFSKLNLQGFIGGFARWR